MKRRSDAAVSKRWRERHPAYVVNANRTANRQRKTQNKRYIDSLKNVPCADCGGRFPAVCMDFDHRPGETKTGEISGFTRGIEALKREIAKCDLVCANCHRIRTAKRIAEGGPRTRAQIDLQLTLSIVEDK